ncbi:hypothetical protein GOP47_0002179 [Adiantum capillus-veneris]|uniref:Uncharacterized protein n=1 Tax=Adiantum capillus-veneris TaxID=13818 RepID=A0A9D4ZQS1_ADICA|nr:hypothetical protein GOP47_0002179 [Adiantum capillus-veneris]
MHHKKASRYNDGINQMPALVQSLAANSSHSKAAPYLLLPALLNITASLQLHASPPCSTGGFPPKPRLAATPLSSAVPCTAPFPLLAVASPPPSLMSPRPYSSYPAPLRPPIPSCLPKAPFSALRAPAQVIVATGEPLSLRSSAAPLPAAP